MLRNMGGSYSGDQGDRPDNRRKYAFRYHKTGKRAYCPEARIGATSFILLDKSCLILI
jgi:hypothetical protein